MLSRKVELRHMVWCARTIVGVKQLLGLFYKRVGLDLDQPEQLIHSYGRR